MSRSAVLSVGGALVAFLLLWQAVVIVSGFPPFILPPPAAVLGRLATAWTAGTIQPHLQTTLVEVALGFVVGAGLGVVAGYALIGLVPTGLALLVAAAVLDGLSISPWWTAFVVAAVLAAADALTRPASSRSTGRVSASAAARTAATTNAVHQGEMDRPSRTAAATRSARPVGTSPISASRTSRPVARSSDVRGGCTAAFCAVQRVQDRTRIWNG